MSIFTDMGVYAGTSSCIWSPRGAMRKLSFFTCMRCGSIGPFSKFNGAPTPLGKMAHAFTSLTSYLIRGGEETLAMKFPTILSPPQQKEN